METGSNDPLSTLAERPAIGADAAGTAMISIISINMAATACVPCRRAREMPRECVFARLPNVFTVPFAAAHAAPCTDYIAFC